MRVNAIYRILGEPPVYLSIGAYEWGKLDHRNRERAYVLTHPCWNFGLKSVYLFMKQAYSLARRNVKLILLSNSPSEARLAGRFGFGGRMINQNIHVAENVFCPVGLKKQYDAVYVGQFRRYKRHYLASRIEKLFIVTYCYPDDPNLATFEPSISHAQCNHRRLSPDEVNEVLNESHVGLALSRKEGPMFASMEYLLAGLPVVSTESVGGRDFFFDDRYVRIVEADPKGVQAAVEEFKRNPVDPQFVRTTTLKKVGTGRRDFFDLISDIARREGCPLHETFESFHERIWGKGGVSDLPDVTRET